MNIGVLYQEFQFILFVVRIHCDGNSPNLGSCIKESQPVGDIGCPDTDMCAMLDSDRQHSFSHPVYTVVEFFPGETQVAIRVNQIFFIRDGFGPVLQPLTQCFVLQLYFHILLSINMGYKRLRVS